MVGLVLFVDGLRVAIMPLGSMLGQQLPERFKVRYILVVACAIGILCTYAEPAIASLRPLAALVKRCQTPYLYFVLNDMSEVLVLSIGLGVGVAAIVGVLRFLRGWSLKPLVAMRCVSRSVRIGERKVHDACERDLSLNRKAGANSWRCDGMHSFGGLFCELWVTMICLAQPAPDDWMCHVHEVGQPGVGSSYWPCLGLRSSHYRPSHRANLAVAWNRCDQGTKSKACCTRTCGSGSTAKQRAGARRIWHHHPRVHVSDSGCVALVHQHLDHIHARGET